MKILKQNLADERILQWKLKKSKLFSKLNPVKLKSSCLDLLLNCVLILLVGSPRINQFH